MVFMIRIWYLVEGKPWYFYVYATIYCDAYPAVKILAFGNRNCFNLKASTHFIVGKF